MNYDLFPLRVQAYAGMVSSSLKDGSTVTRQACYLPLSPDGTPLIGAIPHVDGAFVATGMSLMLDLA